MSTFQNIYKDEIRQNIFSLKLQNKFVDFLSHVNAKIGIVMTQKKTKIRI